VRQVPPTSGSDASIAYAVHLDSGEEPAVLVEYATSAFASVAHARRVVAPYLDAEVMPKRFVVDREGNARARDNE
jgi:hypothetical protein